MESSTKVAEETQTYLHDELVSSIKEKMDTVFPHCICRVGEKFVRENQRFYHPELISIGPFHHGRAELQEMEVQKWRYLHALLNRKPNLEASLGKCVKELRECERKARNCYAEKESIKMNLDEFVTMMLVDGCFIIELFLKFSFRSLRRRGDRIFLSRRMIRTLMSDMVLLENQYPLFVLQRLFGIVPIPEICSLPLDVLAFNFFKIVIPGGNRKAIQEKFNQEGNHLLDSIHNCFIPTFSEVHPPPPDGPSAGKKLRNALKLHVSAGIKFKKADEGVALDIVFKKGVLRIPEVQVHNYTETLLRNLIAGEQCNCDDFEHVTSYVHFLTKLISSNKDEKYLRQKKILSSKLEKKGEVHKLFKKLADEAVNMKHFYFEGLCQQVNGYKKSNLNWFSLPSCLKN